MKLNDYDFGVLERIVEFLDAMTMDDLYKDLKMIIRKLKRDE